MTSVTAGSTSSAAVAPRGRWPIILRASIPGKSARRRVGGSMFSISGTWISLAPRSLPADDLMIEPNAGKDIQTPSPSRVGPSRWLPTCV